MTEVVLATYSRVNVYQTTFNDITLMRRCDDNWVNVTQMLKIAGYDGKSIRTKLLMKEVHDFDHKIVQGGDRRFQGTWVPLELAKKLAERYKISEEKIRVLFYNPETDPPPKVLDKNEQAAKAKRERKKRNAEKLEKSRLLDLNGSDTSINKLNTSNNKRFSTLSTTVTSHNVLAGKFNDSHIDSNQIISPSHSGRMNTTGSNQNMTLPPTFAMYHNNPNTSSDPAKSQYYQNNDAATNQYISPSYNSNEEMQKTYQQLPFNVQSHQMNAQRELQLLQQQKEIQHRKTQQGNHLINQSQQQNFYTTPVSDELQHSIKDNGDVSMNSSYLGYESNSMPIIQPHEHMQQDYQPNRSHVARAHSQSLSRQQSLSEESDFFTSQLLSFFINDSPVPSFLFNPPPEFDINKSIDDEGHTPLHWASALASVEIIELLVSKNANTLVLNNSGMNSLSKSIHFSNSFDWKNFNLILPLLKHCLIVPDGNNRTPLHYLMELSSNVNKINSTRYYFKEILDFIKIQQLHAEKQLREQQRKNSSNGSTDGNVQILNVLINHVDNNGETALHLALKTKSNDLVKELIKNGADPRLVGVEKIPVEIFRELDNEARISMNQPRNNKSMLMKHRMPQQQRQQQQQQQNYYFNNTYNDSSQEQIDMSVNLNVNMPLVDQTGTHQQSLKYIRNESNLQFTPILTPYNQSLVDNSIQHMDNLVDNSSVNFKGQREEVHANTEINPFLDENNVKYTPRTISDRGSPRGDHISAFDGRGTILNTSKKSDDVITSTPTLMKEEDHMQIDGNSTIEKKVDVLDQYEGDDPIVAVKKEDSEEDILKIKKSKINIEEVDNFVDKFPQMISEIKNKLESKTDTLNYNIETINKLNHEILSINHKNAKFLRKISKICKKDTTKADSMKIANSSTKTISNFIGYNHNDIDSELTFKSQKLLDLYERKQALDVAKLVNKEENSIMEESLFDSSKMSYAVKLTLLQIKRRKIIEQTLNLYLNEGGTDEDFNFEENAVDASSNRQNIEDLKLITSKVSVYRKLISRICGLQESEINGELLNEIEKVLA